jgi:hypothetical protein
LPAKKTKLQEMEPDQELNFNSLIPFMNHPLGYKKFSENVKKYPSDPAPKFFVFLFSLSWKIRRATLRKRTPWKLLRHGTLGIK